MTEEQGLRLVNAVFLLAQGNVERSTVIDRLQGVPPEKYPDILDAMFAESQKGRDAAIGAAPE